MSTAAVVVSYFPETNVLIRLLEVLIGQVDCLILVDNGGGFDVVNTVKAHGVAVEYIELGRNAGLGHALNIGFEKALNLGAKYVATFDQDSAPSQDLIANLRIAHERLQDKGINCAAVAPVFFDRRESEKIYFPFYREINGRIVATVPNNSPEDYVEADSLITSGMLVRTDVWASGVCYDEGLFVDYTDPEWCFRARSNGYKLYGCLKIEMGHAPSDSPPARIFGFSFFRYSPLRRYYYFRNTVQFCKADYVSEVWKRRLGLGLFLRFFVNFLIDDKKISSLKMMVLGFYHGLIGKTGEFR